jgi:hypothetical protein
MALAKDQVLENREVAKLVNSLQSEIKKGAKMKV